MTGDEPDPGELLAAADRLLSGRVPHTAGLWPRPVAFLTRLALERAIGDLLARREPGLAAVQSWRARFLCLPAYTGADLAARASYLWHVLSTAGHYHAYEIPPAATELRRWHSEVKDLVARLEREQPPARRGRPTG